MSDTRSTAVAGTFYSNEPDQLRTEVQEYLRQGRPASGTPKAIIAPHAGYMYSGPVAGSAYAPLLHSPASRVVLLGPAHRVYVAGVAASSASAFATPLGEVAVDRDAVELVMSTFDFVHYNDEAHRHEHSLEVQLPFLQSILGEFLLVPFAVGDLEPGRLTPLLMSLWGDDSTIVVVSSDLSHYHDYADACRRDAFTTAKIEQLDPSGLTPQHACGQIPISALLECATEHDLRCEAVDVRNSGDTAGSRERVVGYGAYIFYRRI